jgi:hypothetical protein
MSSITLEHFTGLEAAAAGARQLVEEFVSGLLGRSVDAEAMFAESERRWIFCQLSRAVELAKTFAPGERLVWTLEDLDAAELEHLLQPQLDQFIKGLRPRLLGQSDASGSCWPQNRPFALCLSHDMDHVTAFAGREHWRAFRRYTVQPGKRPGEMISRGCRSCKSLLADWARRDLVRERDPLGNVEAWLKLEDDCGFKSSLFFFAESVQPWHPFDCNYAFRDKVQFEGMACTVGEMMREIARRGWDVGVHGSLASATVPGVLQFQKQQVETVLGQPAVTTRQHYLEYDPGRTASLQAQAGFLADGTQGFNDTVGFRAGTSFPYRVWNWAANCALPLWQVPLHIQDGPLLRRWNTVDTALEICRQFMDRVEAVGGCLSLLFHPAHLVTDLGFTVYREVLLEARRRRAWGCSLREVAEWWQQHTKAINQPCAPYEV